MKWKIDDVPVFVAVVEQNGVSAAAKHLKMPKSSVSIGLSRLETGLGVRLIERNSRNLQITPEGERFYRRAQMIVEQVQEADAAISGVTATPKGRLSVAMPAAFAQEVLAPHLARFREIHPGVDLELVMTTQGLRMAQDQVDLAIAVGSLPETGLETRSLECGPLIWVTSPDYGRRLPLCLAPDKIAQHVQFCETRYGRARFPVCADGRATHVDLLHNVSHVDDPLVVREAVRNGAGVAPLPRRFCTRHLNEGTLVEVFSSVRCTTAATSFTAVCTGRSLMSPRVRVFLDFLTALCATG